MKHKSLIIWITMALMLAAMLAAFSYGKASADNSGQKSYFDSLNDYDWSRTCPAAGCRSQDGEKQDAGCPVKK